MRAFTSIEQSKTLAKILPIESADIWYAEIYEGKTVGYDYIVSDTPCYSLSFVKPSENNYSQNTVKDIPAWSLAALLEVIPHEIKIWDLTYDIKIYPRNNNWFMSYKNNNEEFVGTYSTFLIDACVEMIIKLNELKLLCL